VIFIESLGALPHDAYSELQCGDMATTKNSIAVEDTDFACLGIEPNSDVFTHTRRALAKVTKVNGTRTAPSCPDLVINNGSNRSALSGMQDKKHPAPIVAEQIHAMPSEMAGRLLTRMSVTHNQH
jgi:hypothetical protein